MFTGIVQGVTTIEKVERKNRIIHMRLKLPSRWKLKEGQSVSINGICTTVVKSSARFFDVDYMGETIRKTTVANWKAGMQVNLERSLSYGDPVDGHFLTGHIDATASVKKVETEGASSLITVSLPKSLQKQVQLHGSIALDGVSLTVARMRGERITVALVPYTLQHTTLSLRTVGDKVNIETDRARVPVYASRTRARRS